MHRFAVKPHHLDTYLDIWADEVALYRRHGFTIHRAFVETDAEPKLTWLYAHDYLDEAQAAVTADPERKELDERKAPHVFRNTTIRPVEVEVMTEPADLTWTAVMRRYAITGSWDEFLAIWRRVRVVRERYGFPCLFAVADRPQNMFTWAFGFDGPWPDFAAAQRPYYHDPQRVELRAVFDYMADYSIHPARQLALPD